MKAGDILPFTFAMGAATLFLYFISGDAIYIGENIAYLTITLFIFILWVMEGRQKVNK